MKLGPFAVMWGWGLSQELRLTDPVELFKVPVEPELPSRKLKAILF